MRSLSVRLLLSLFALVLAAPVVLAHDVTLSGTTTFAAIDGSANDHDGSANGVFTVSDGNLVINGTVNCNDDGGGDSACSMAFAVSGNLTINNGAALYAENRTGGGTGGAITLTVGGNMAMNGNAIVSTSSRSSSGATGGNITANVGGSVTLASGTTIDAGSANAKGGNVTIAAGDVVTANGAVYSGPSRTLIARWSGSALDGGTNNQQGGAITISSSTFAEPAILIGSTANIVAQGETSGAGPVTIDGCGIQIYGVVAALSRKDAPAKVVIRSGKDVLVDGRDLGTTATARLGRVRADAPSGTAVNKGVDIFAAETIDLLGASPSASTQYSVTSIPGQHDSKSYGGLIRVMSLGDVVNASGLVIDDGHTASGDTGGTVQISSKLDANLAGAYIRAIGDFNTNNGNRGGGSISIRSYSGNVIWTNGLGEVRPVGSSSGLASGDQGKILINACGSITTTGTSFPVMGTATSVFPETHTGVCSPAAPSLPAGVPALVTCNTPPVANDTTASTLEDQSVTITLTGSDADGDSLTFSIVSGPSNGTLTSLMSTGPTSATVVYTPNLNFNGTDSFTFRANDGNGGTDDAVATVTITAVNDAPSFQIGPTATALEDSGAQTYANWVTSISAGPADEAGQSVTFTVTNDNPSLFAVQPAVAPNGTLTYTPASNAYGTANVTVVAHDNGGTANGGVDTSAPQTSSLSITGVNDAPSFTAGGNVTVLEDSGAYSAAWASGISAGPNETQNVSFNVSNNNNALFASQPAVSASGVLTFTTAANANGSATVTVTAQDDGGTANGGVDTSAAQTFTITITAVNDAPSFTSGGNVTVLEDSGAYSAAWATAISAGPADESGQTVSFSASNDNNALFSAQPAVSASGVLTFTLAANAYGSATVTVSLSDDGGTANGGVDTSAAQTFTINVTGVNDEPAFTAGGNVTVLEDSGAYSAAWASGISAGPNESSQTVAFNVSNDNNGLFSAQPAISASGVLTFTTAANAYGTANVTVSLSDDGGTANGGDDTSSSVTFTITLDPVNDAPSFTSGGNVSVGEDSGAYSAAWATAISAGPANESAQTVMFNVTGNSNPSLFSVQPAIAANGALSFTPAANATGSATITVVLQDNGGTANGGVDTSSAVSFTISVSGVNDPPSFTLAGTSTTSLEDGGPQTVLNWATSISSGPGESDNVTFVVSNDNNTLFSVQPAIAPDGTLTYTAAPNANGVAMVTVYAQDDGGTANGGNDTSASQTFTIVVTAVNDAPSFTSGGDVTVLEDSGAYSAAWATAISAGPADESGQALSFSITANSNPSLFSAGPSVAPDGTLTFTPAANAFGSATITVQLSDNGGTANGGADTSATQTFTINVGAVNDAPSFVAGGNVTVNEDSGAYSAAWASAISAGPNESGQSVSFVVTSSNNGLFSAQPAISPSGVLTFTPAANAFGSATVTVYLTDNGGTANGGVDTSGSVTFTITVNGVNDPPNAGNDSFETFGNTEIRVDLAGVSTPYVAATTGSGTGVLDNDADTVEGDPFSITSIVGCADTTAPFDCTLAGGAQLSMNANGSFTYTPAPGATSGSFQYVVTDNPSAGSPASATGTVTFTITNMIWYVNGSYVLPGNGTSNAPYANFGSLNGGPDVDSPGDTIFVHNSTVNGNITMEANQKLLGEGVGLTVLNSSSVPVTLVPAGTKPHVLGGAADTVTVTGVTGVEVAGLELSSTGGNGIEVRSNALGSATAANIHDNFVNGAAAQGIFVNANATAGTTATVSNTNIVSTGTGFEATSTAGTVNVAYNGGTITSSGSHGVNINGAGGGTMNVTGLSNLTVAASTANDGIRVTSASFASVNTGTLNVGSSGARVKNGVSLTNVSGTLAFGTLNAYTTGGTGLGATAAGSFTISGTSGTINSVNGTAVSLNNATIGASDLTLTSVSSTNAVNGIVLNTTGSLGGLHVTGTGSAGSGGTLSGHSGDAVLLTSSEDLALGYMNIANNLGNGIKGTTVNGFVVDNCSITGNGNDVTTDESGINLTNLTGGASRPTSISNSTISNNYEFEVQISNNAGTLTNMQMTNDTISSNGLSGVHGNLVNFLGLGTAAMTLNVTGGTYTGAAPATATAVFADHSGSAGSLVANVSGATFTNNNSGVNVSAAGGPNVTFDVNGNTVNGSRSHALNLFLAASHSGTASGKFRNNIIGTTGVAGSGSQFGFGVRVQNEALSAATVLVDNNTISEMAGFAAVNVNAGISTSPGTATTAMTITNNLISNVNARAIIVQQNVGKGTVCANIANNNMSGIAGQAGDGTKIRIRQLTGGTFNVTQKQATAAADPAELDDANSVGANTTTAAQISASGTFNYNAAACAQP